jgi:prepilin-type N-terminal cleavage/methylation domain-containing protein
MLSNHSHDIRGMTLLETMIALLIFSIGVLGIASMQVCSMFNNAKALRLTEDEAAACRYLETILALPFEDPLLSDPDDGYAPSNPDHGPFVVASTSSTIEWEVDDQFPVNNAKRITLWVRLGGQGGSAPVLSFEYIKAKGVVNASRR